MEITSSLAMSSMYSISPKIKPKDSIVFRACLTVTLVTFGISTISKSDAFKVKKIFLPSLTFEFALGN